MVEIANGTSITVFTNSSGFYTTKLPIGTHNVSASATGYGSETAAVVILGNMITVQDFALSPRLPATVVGGTLTPINMLRAVNVWIILGITALTVTAVMMRRRRTFVSTNRY